MKDNKLYLTHILECIEKIISYTSSGENEFAKSTLLQDAVIRNFEIIGEATKNLSLDFRERHPEIPWRKMAGHGSQYPYGMEHCEKRSACIETRH